MLFTKILEKFTDEFEDRELFFTCSFRLQTPVGTLFRSCTTDTQIPYFDHTIRKNDRIIIPVSGIHMDERYYPNPHQGTLEQNIYIFFSLFSNLLLICTNFHLFFVFQGTPHGRFCVPIFSLKYLLTHRKYKWSLKNRPN